MFGNMKYKRTILACLSFLAVVLISSSIYSLVFERNIETDSASKTKISPKVKTARVVANGDILIHDLLYMSAEQADGTYDFNPYFTYVKDWISEADLAIGDYEGTIAPDYPLAGYPLFNAPSEIAQTIKDTGYDVVDLDHVNMDSVDAIIVSGADANLMNMQDAHTNVPVINAAGKSPDEILEELERL